MWSKSQQRKMIRLYVYTTLPLPKIIDVIHHNSKIPGKDSANKYLKLLLDKQPRWLHPKSHADMGRRVQQLSLSSRMADSSDDFAQSRAPSDPPDPSFFPFHFKLESEGMATPDLLAIPPQPVSASSAPATPVSLPGRVGWASNQRPKPSSKEVKDGILFAPFLRRATVTSSSTTTSSSSLKTVLSDYTSAYRGVVKRLIRRFSRPLTRCSNMSPVSESNSAVMDWLEDEQAPDAYHVRPYPLPGDFLSIDRYGQCPLSHDHASRRCLCSAGEECLQQPTHSLPWVTPIGMTELGSRVAAGEVEDVDWCHVDAFGNTILHFVAARGSATLLLDLVREPYDKFILLRANSAGQTFLHVMSPQSMMQTDTVSSILEALKDTAVDIYAQDSYGRNVFHMMRASGVEQDKLDRVLEKLDAAKWNRRDAFAETPQPKQTPTTSSEPEPDHLIPDEKEAVSAQAQILSFVNAAIDGNPASEDSQGRNGLHCLAAAKFSMSKTHMDSGAHTPTVATGSKTTDGAPARKKRRISDDKKDSDSSTERMKFRLSLLEHLLQVGANPNSYDRHGTTPLMAFAAQLPEDGDYKFGPRMLEALLEGGANIHARNRAGETALHIAVRCGRKLAARTLVQAGANVHVRDAMGRSVLDVADAKILAACEERTKEYARLEACRAWLSGDGGGAVQCPTVMQEWGRR